MQVRGSVSAGGLAASWRTAGSEDGLACADCCAQVLVGVVILFSALVPLGQDPRSHNLGQLAEQYGARCVTKEDDSVTHVVASSNGSTKARWALASGRHLVSRHW